MGSPIHPEQVAERIRTILRRDLKLGCAAELPDTTPLIGGNLDLDSLDVLLLITNLEKEFGFKIASQEVGRAAFETVGSLIGFVKAKCEGGAEASADAPLAQAPTDLLAQLPHRDPFRFITKVANVQPGVSGEATWVLSGSEAFFAGHFPGNPLVPGVLIAEALAQLSGLVGAAGGGDATKQGMLAQVDVRFMQAVAPPAEITLQSRALGVLGSLRQFEVMALVKETPVAQGTVTIAYDPAEATR